MHDADDTAYFLRRERQQRLLADRATNPAIAEIHRAMADRYAREARSAQATTAPNHD